MPLPTRKLGPTVCSTCNAHARKLSRLTIRTRSGKRLDLPLCVFCYRRRAPRARTGEAR